MLKKCSCGEVFNSYKDIKEPIAINELGFWFNCQCGSTLLIEEPEIPIVTPCDTKKTDVIYLDAKTFEVTEVVRKGKVIYETTTDN